jgi:hypothetical protein
MNIRRGLFRLWIVLSALWIGLGLVLSHGFPAIADLPLVVVPPAVLFVLGWAGVWAFSGFKRN